MTWLQLRISSTIKQLVATIEDNTNSFLQWWAPFVLSGLLPMVPVAHFLFNTATWDTLDAVSITLIVVLCGLAWYFGFYVMAVLCVGILDFRRRYLLQKAITRLVTRTTTFSSDMLVGVEGRKEEQAVSPQNTAGGTHIEGDQNRIAVWPTTLEEGVAESTGVSQGQGVRRDTFLHSPGASASKSTWTSTARL